MSDDATQAEAWKTPTDSGGQADDHPAGKVMPFGRLRVGARAVALAGIALTVYGGISTPTHTGGSWIYTGG